MPMEESAGAMLHATPLTKSVGGFQWVCTIPRRVVGDTECTSSCSSPWESQDTIESNSAQFSVGFFPQAWGGSEVQSLDCGGLPWAARPIDVVEIGGGQFKAGEVYSIKPLAAFALVDDMGLLSWKVVAIDAEDALAGDLNSLEDLHRQMPGLLKFVKEWLHHCASDSSVGTFTAFGFNGRPQDAELATRVIMESHANWAVLYGEKEGKQGKVSEHASSECTKLPRPRRPTSLSALPASMPHAHITEEPPCSSAAPPIRRINSHDLELCDRTGLRERDLNKIARQVRLVAERVANPTLPSHDSNPALVWDLTLADGGREKSGGGVAQTGGGLRAAKAAEQQQALELLADGMKRLRQLSEKDKYAKKSPHPVWPPRLQLPLHDDVALHIPLPDSAALSPDSLLIPIGDATHHALTSPRPLSQASDSLPPRSSAARCVQGQVSFHLARIGSKEEFSVTEALEVDVSENDIPVASVLYPCPSPSLHDGASSFSSTPSLSISLRSNFSTSHQSSPTSSLSPHRKVSFNEFVEVITFER